MLFSTHLVLGIVLGLMALNSVREKIPDSSAGDITCVDIDGNKYRTVHIGRRVWMAENLRVRHYRNSEPIIEQSSNQYDVDANNRWKATIVGAYSLSTIGSHSSAEEVVVHVMRNGLLYNWYALNDWRGLCPTGWRVPTDADWLDLERYAGVPLEMLTSDSPTRGEEEVVLAKLEELKFNMTLSGAKWGNGWDFRVGTDGQYWSKTESEENSAWARWFELGKNGIRRISASKFAGLSCRCVKE